MKKTHTIKDFLPLIIIYAFIIMLTFLKLYVLPAPNERYWHEFMHDFMGIMFVVMGVLKILDLKGFAHFFSMYDLIAQKITLYGFVYPFIELGLGVLYLFRWHLMAANWITFIFMSIGAIGVWLKLSSKEEITCACMGIIKVPLTYITLVEDALMALMAMVMILYM